MSAYPTRLTALRAELSRGNLNGFVVPRTDEHLGEYIGEYAKRLAWLTGFTGSAGIAAVLPNSAALFVDGRYSVQAREQVSDYWNQESLSHTSVSTWLGQNAEANAIIGYDPWLHTQKWVTDVQNVLKPREVKLIAIEPNPIDTLWKDRPEPSSAPLAIHSEAFAGRSAGDKRREVAEWLVKGQGDAVIFCALDSIAWLFNIRGRDVSYTPLARAYAIVRSDASADLFVEPEKVSASLIAHLGTEVLLRPRSVFLEALAQLHGVRVSIDPERTPSAVQHLLQSAGTYLVEAREPVFIAKARKNAQEIDGAKAAHVRDGVAVTRFLHWLEHVAARGGHNEVTAARKLSELRREDRSLQDLSFETISAVGPNAALPHYRPSANTARSIERNCLYLCDSGGQYLDGTTDITRTVAIGKPTEEMRDRFTRVLKGNIALATAVFPEGTTGGQLDAFARQYLWRVGLDYEHGTGHGVGSYLAVHEGPQRIAKVGSQEPLQAGMILSNEPGYYKVGAYGIRIENLMIVECRPLSGAEKPMLGFRTLTLAPLDRALVAAHLLTQDECQWLNDYHSLVYRELAPFLHDDVRSWLAHATCVFRTILTADSG